MFFSPYLCIGCGVPPKGLIHNLVMRFFTLSTSKIKVSKIFL